MNLISTTVHHGEATDTHIRLVSSIVQALLTRCVYSSQQHNFSEQRGCLDAQQM